MQARIRLQSVRRMLNREVVRSQRLPANNPMSVAQAFLLVTRNGALALHRNDIGILAPSTKADLLVWNGRSPSILGWSDPVAAIMLHASIGDIKHVMVDGVFKKRDGRLVVDGYERLQERFLRSAERIQRIWRETPLPVLEGISGTGVMFESIENVDVVRGEDTGYGGRYTNYKGISIEPKAVGTCAQSLMWRCNVKNTPRMDDAGTEEGVTH